MVVAKGRGGIETRRANGFGASSPLRMVQDTSLRWPDQGCSECDDSNKDGDEKEMSLKDDPVYRDLAVVLHEAWKRVDWKRMGTSKTRRATDIFQHRLKKAGYQGGIAEAIERLCKGLSLQSLNLPVGLVNRLKQEEKHVMDVLRTQSVVLTLLAQQGPSAIDTLEE